LKKKTEYITNLSIYLEIKQKINKIEIIIITKSRHISFKKKKKEEKKKILFETNIKTQQKNMFITHTHTLSKISYFYSFIHP